MITTDGGRFERGMRLSSGAHWASGTRSRKVPFDIGAGVVYERGAGSATEKSGGPASEPTEEDARAEKLGGYLEASSRLWARGVTRAWVGGRAEVLRDHDRRATMSLTGRISWEVYAGGTAAEADGSGNAFVAVAGAGTIGLGSYVESGVRRDGDGRAEVIVTAGLSLRLPAWIALVIGCR